MRARNIKPGFFTNEQLAECCAEARLLFAGLWCLADRAGRLEDRPKRIKMNVFPADAWECEPLLAELAEQGLIVRYDIDGLRCIDIPGFLAHQRPHHTEKDSELPERIPGNAGLKGVAIPEKPTLDDSDTPENSGNNPPSRAGDSGESASRSALIPDSLIPDPGSLIPDPGSLIPDPPPLEGARRPAKRCPEDFEITPELRAWAAEKCPGVDIDAETETFREFEFARAYTDWPATWRRWMKRATPKRQTTANGYKPSRTADELEAELRAQGIDPETYVATDPRSSTP